MRTPWSALANQGENTVHIYADGQKVEPGDTPRDISDRIAAKESWLSRRRARVRANARLVRTVGRATMDAWRSRQVRP